MKTLISKNALQLLLTLCIWVIYNNQVIAQSSAKTYSIPFKLTSQNNIAIRALINGQDTVSLMFHTAANSLTLTTEAISKMKSPRFEGADTVKSWGGGENSSRYSKNNLLQIGKKKWDHIPLWENLNSGPGTGGKFGPELFEGQFIDIDFDKKIMTISNDLPAKAKAYTKLEAEYKDDMLFINAGCEIGTEQLSLPFLIHSGYAGAVLFDDTFTNNNQLDQKLKIVSEKNLKDSFGNVLTVKRAVLPALIMGENKLNEVPAGFFKGAIGRQKMSIIGGELLKRFNIVISADRKVVYLKPNGLFNLPYPAS
ncbi:aspartyl protease family protein [Pedobacter soli]|uniref:Aspartyl protease n=1 Tax=Pedobacter soli TaxID=390242 RepID=A0A1G6S6S4_9SPHI|nr:aspartyl protease family protein [Pedobacter soli]SDD12539.1 Aspartyl protease [Pedobacter soli]